jgi:hypothetical protein
MARTDAAGRWSCGTSRHAVTPGSFMADGFPPGSAIVSDLPRHAFTRTARMARLPAGFAGRTAPGTGKRLGGRPAELVNLEIQERTAAQVFRVLGKLKGQTGTDNIVVRAVEGHHG